MSAELAVSQNNVLAHPAMNDGAIINAQNFMPVMEIDDILKRHAALLQFRSQVLVENQDFGKIPGTGDKPTLLKPGAEKLCTLFGLTPRPVLIGKIEDWDGKDHGGEPFFYYWYRMELFRGNQLIAAADGSCNSRESKYRWRKSERLCPSCGKPAIIKGKAEFGGGWVCFKKKDGCNAKFADGDPAIESQQAGRVPNPDIADQVNTMQKMALKRALVGVTLIGINASDFFTQDIEDMHVNQSAANRSAARDDIEYETDYYSESHNGQPVQAPANRSTPPPKQNDVARLRSEFNSLHKEADNCDVPRLTLPESANTPEKIQTWINGYKNKIAAAQPPESIPVTPPETTTGNAASSFQKTKAARVSELADEYKNSGDELDDAFENAIAGDADSIEGEVVEDAPTAPPQGAMIFDIPAGTVPSKCRSCEARIFWIETKNGKKMPANEDGTSHFSTCPNAPDHRAPKESKHLAALMIAAQNAGFTTEREPMIKVINSYMAGPNFTAIESRKELSGLQCSALISAIEGGFLVWDSAVEGGSL